MSSPKVFITGVTGYIGGDLLYLLNETHSTWQITCLVRDAAKASDLVARYPHVHVVDGDLDSTDLIEEEAAKANIVYHCASSDHLASAKAIAQGLARNPSSPAYWIHTSGTGILTHQNFARNYFESAVADDKIYDDWDHVDELTSLPDKALHRHVDKIVLAASSGHSDDIKTAIVAPPAIYGVGRGTGNVRSVQINMTVRLSLQNGRAVQMGDGTSIWHGVHVHDLSQLFLLLGESAISADGKASWNQTGYYLAEDGSFTWGDIAQAVADEGRDRGYLTTNDLESLTFAQAQKLHEWYPYLCGTTSRGVSKRARILLGWKPQQKKVMEELPQVIEDEARALGMNPRKQGSP